MDTETESKFYQLFRLVCEDVDQLIYNCNHEQSDRESVREMQQTLEDTFGRALLGTAREVEKSRDNYQPGKEDPSPQSQDSNTAAQTQESVVDAEEDRYLDPDKFYLKRYRELGISLGEKVFEVETDVTRGCYDLSARGVAEEALKQGIEVLVKAIRDNLGEWVYYQNENCYKGEGYTYYDPPEVREKIRNDILKRVQSNE